MKKKLLSTQQQGWGEVKGEKEELWGVFSGGAKLARGP